MSRLEQLISELCPDGVEFHSMWELTIWDKRFNGVERYKQSKTDNYHYYLASELKELSVQDGDVRLLFTSDNDIGFTTKEIAGEHLREAEVVAIPWGGTPRVQYYKGQFVTSDNRIARTNDPSRLSTKYLYYWMLTNVDLLCSFYRGAGIAHPSMAQVLDMRVPVPPLLIQEEIVRILDTFTALEVELEAELEARTKQYETYRDSLLNFDPENPHPLHPTRLNHLIQTLCPDGVETGKTQDVCVRVCSGGTPIASRSEYYGGNIPWLRTQEVDYRDIWDTEIKITDQGFANSSASWIPENCVIVAMYGASAARVAINKIPLTTNQACCNLEIDQEKANYRYVYHWLVNQYEDLKSLSEGAQPNLNVGKVKNYPIPLPPLPVQEEIVAILDRFDALVNDLKNGLPAEIAARRKQYEYYRDQLLTFKPLE